MQRSFCALLLFVLFSNVTLLHAQEGQRARFALEVADTLRFHRVATDGSTSFVYELPDNFALQLVGELGISQDEEWIIPTPISVTLSPSPNGDRIAFVALQNYTNAALFWIDLDSLTLHQSPLPGIGGLQWSPDGNAVLVSPAYTGFIDLREVDLSEAYLYTFTSSALTSVPNPNTQRQAAYRWLDTQRITFSSLEACEAPCINSINNFLLDLNNESVTRLTDIGDRLVVDIGRNEFQFYSYCSTGPEAPFTLNARLYYAVTCVDDVERRHSFLYSVDKLGNERLEADIAPLFTDEAFTRIRGIDIAESTIIFAVESEKASKAEGLDALYGTWRIFILNAPETFQVISETELKRATLGTIYDIGVSPNHQYIAVAGSDYAVAQGLYQIIDLESREGLIQATMPNGICNVDWFDDTHLLLVEYEADCLWTFDYPIRTTLLDVTTGAQERIFSELDGQVWLLN